MALGKITEITLDPNTQLSSGTLLDIDTLKRYAFSNQPGLEDVNKQDIVDYTLLEGAATELKPNLSVKLRGLNNASREVQLAVDTLLKAMAKDTNMTDVVVRKV